MGVLAALTIAFALIADLFLLPALLIQFDRQRAAPLHIWASGVTGDVAGRDFEVEFSDILDNTEAGATAFFEARKKRWSIGIDYQFVDVRPSIENPVFETKVRPVLDW